MLINPHQFQTLMAVSNYFFFFCLILLSIALFKPANAGGDGKSLTETEPKKVRTSGFLHRKSNQVCTKSYALPEENDKKKKKSIEGRAYSCPELFKNIIYFPVIRKLGTIKDAFYFPNPNELDEHNVPNQQGLLEDNLVEALEQNPNAKSQPREEKKQGTNKKPMPVPETPGGCEPRVLQIKKWKFVKPEDYRDRGYSIVWLFREQKENGTSKSNEIYLAIKQAPPKAKLGEKRKPRECALLSSMHKLNPKKIVKQFVVYNCPGTAAEGKEAGGAGPCMQNSILFFNKHFFSGNHAVVNLLVMDKLQIGTIVRDCPELVHHILAVNEQQQQQQVNEQDGEKGGDREDEKNSKSLKKKGIDL